MFIPAVTAGILRCRKLPQSGNASFHGQVAFRVLKIYSYVSMILPATLILDAMPEYGQRGGVRFNIEVLLSRRLLKTDSEDEPLM